MLFIITIVSILLSSCCKDDTCDLPKDPCELNPCNDTTGMLMGKLDTLWTEKIQGITGSVVTKNLFIENSDVILGGSGSMNAFVMKFQSQNGNEMWRWISEEKSFPVSHLHKNQLILQNEIDIYAVTSTQGILERQFREPLNSAAHSYGQVLGNYFYFTIRSKDNVQAWLIRSHVSDLQNWDTVYHLKSDEAINFNRPNIQSYNLWLDPISGDSILIFQHRMLNRVDVLAWNMSKREVKWRHDDITNLGNSNHQQILIYDNKAYFGGGTTFYCFEIISGQILWKYDHPSGINSFMLYNPVVAEDEKLIVVKDAGGEFRGFDLMTGTVRMFSAGSGSSTASSGSPIYYKGVVYFTERGLLYAIRATNGSLLWSERSSRHPMGSTSFQGELAIDRERGILYATDEDELFAIRVIE